MNKQFIKDTYISIVDFFLPLKGEINQNNGITQIDYSLYDVDLVDSMKGLRERLLESDSFMNYIASKGFAQCQDFADIMSFHPRSVDLINDSVATMVKNYLGRNVKLDSALLSVMNMDESKNKSENNSGLLHHDSVGHRLKLFFPINTRGNLEYPTVFVDKSHKIKWKTHLNLKNSNGDRIPENIVEAYRPIDRYEKIAHFGTGYLFDTNAIHSGCYNPSLEPRMMIQFEFSSMKSHFPGQVGPDQFTLSEYAYERLKKHHLIRSNRVSVNANGAYIHKGRGRRREPLDLFKIV